MSHTYDMSAISNLARGAPVTAYGSFCSTGSTAARAGQSAQGARKGGHTNEISDYDAKAHSVPSLEDMGYEEVKLGALSPAARRAASSA